ncbi:MAG: hypothetical protein RL701_4171 [Pseudomonadota bacterium]|jgi:hypothetical protein
MSLATMRYVCHDNMRVSRLTVLLTNASQRWYIDHDCAQVTSTRQVEDANYAVMPGPACITKAGMSDAQADAWGATR